MTADAINAETHDMVVDQGAGFLHRGNTEAAFETLGGRTRLHVESVESDGSLRIVRAELAAALRANTQSGLLTGDIAFDERGDRAGDTARALGLRVYRVTGGIFVPVD